MGGKRRKDVEVKDKTPANAKGKESKDSDSKSEDNSTETGVRTRSQDRRGTTSLNNSQEFVPNSQEKEHSDEIDKEINDKRLVIDETCRDHLNDDEGKRNGKKRSRSRSVDDRKRSRSRSRSRAKQRIKRRKSTIESEEEGETTDSDLDSEQNTSEPSGSECESDIEMSIYAEDGGFSDREFSDGGHRYRSRSRSRQRKSKQRRRGRSTRSRSRDSRKSRDKEICRRRGKRRRDTDQEDEKMLKIVKMVRKQLEKEYRGGGKKLQFSTPKNSPVKSNSDSELFTPAIKPSGVSKDLNEQLNRLKLGRQADVNSIDFCLSKLRMLSDKKSTSSSAHEDDTSRETTP